MRLFVLRFTCLYSFLLLIVGSFGIFGAPLCPHYRFIRTPNGDVWDSTTY